MNARDIRIGDTVIWKGSYGEDPARPVVVKGIELCKGREAYGFPVESAPVNEIERYVFDLDNGKWAYGYQIRPVDLPADQPTIATEVEKATDRMLARMPAHVRADVEEFGRSFDRGLQKLMAGFIAPKRGSKPEIF